MSRICRMLPASPPGSGGRRGQRSWVLDGRSGRPWYRHPSIGQATSPAEPADTAGCHFSGHLIRRGSAIASAITVPSPAGTGPGWGPRCGSGRPGSVRFFPVLAHRHPSSPIRPSGNLPDYDRARQPHISAIMLTNPPQHRHCLEPRYQREGVGCSSGQALLAIPLGRIGDIPGRGKHGGPRGYDCDADRKRALRDQFRFKLRMVDLVADGHASQRW
jgi:hypothetical protein